jgi:acetyl esterase/lipase
MLKVLATILTVVAGLIAAAWAIPWLFFTGADHSAYDEPRPVPEARAAESSEHRGIAQQIAGAPSGPASGGRAAFLQRIRADMDAAGARARIASTVTPVDAAGVRGEWVTAPNAVPGRRVLYIHGGGYMMGSPRSHRLVTSRMSEASRAAVLAIDYRLLPEHSRMAGIDDCRAAYQWLLANGPGGASPPDALILAGDSSGGNLVLSTIAWARDEGLRLADALVLFSPQTDATFASPSHRSNLATDIVQRGGLAPVVKAPKPMALWMSFLMHRINPRDPLVSPLFGDLAGLPPTLIQVSRSEMFLDDAVRYANKATAQGSGVLLQTWPHTMHGWHAMEVPEADAAFDEVRAFLSRSPSPIRQYHQRPAGAT